MLETNSYLNVLTGAIVISILFLGFGFLGAKLGTPKQRIMPFHLEMVCDVVEDKFQCNVDNTEKGK